jgi:hypothetical protein
MDMKASRFTEEQIIAILREQEAGAATGDVCRKHGISSASECGYATWPPNAAASATVVSISF